MIIASWNWPAHSAQGPVRNGGWTVCPSAVFIGGSTRAYQAQAARRPSRARRRARPRRKYGAVRK